MLWIGIKLGKTYLLVQHGLEVPVPVVQKLSNN
jgi:hypothetical protein